MMWSKPHSKSLSSSRTQLAKSGREVVANVVGGRSTSGEWVRSSSADSAPSLPETLEDHERWCTCICDPFGGGTCNHCMDECELK